MHAFYKSPAHRSPLNARTLLGNLFTQYLAILLCLYCTTLHSNMHLRKSHPSSERLLRVCHRLFKDTTIAYTLSDSWASTNQETVSGFEQNDTVIDLLRSALPELDPNYESVLRILRNLPQLTVISFRDSRELTFLWE